MRLRLTWLYQLGFVFLLAVFSGCGGDESTSLPEDDIELAAAANEPAAAAPAPVAAAPAEAPPVAPPAAPPPRPMPPPPPPKRPDDVTQWQPGDFRSARAERDPKLVTALEAFGARSAGDNNAVALIVELLTPEKPPEAPPAGQPTVQRFGGGPGVRPPDNNVVVALIAAAAKINTPDADQLLERLLTREFDPGINIRNVSESVIKSIAENPSQRHSEMLLTAALTPEKYRPPTTPDPMPGLTGGGGSQSPTQLRQDATNRIKTAPTAELRMLLARRLLESGLTGEEARPFQQMLLEPKGENLEAQIFLYQQPQLDPAMKTQIEQLLTQLAMASLNQLLGIPSRFKAQAPTGYSPGVFVASGGSGGGNGNKYRIGDPIFPAGFDFNAGGRAREEAERKAAAARSAQAAGARATTPANDTADRLAGVFWKEEFVAPLLQQTSGVEKLADAMPAAILAAAIPTHESRANLARLTAGMWDVGTKDLHPGGLFGEQFHDPAALVVFKEAPRKEEPTRAEKRSGKTDTRRTNTRTRQRNATPKINPKEVPRFEFMQATEEMVYVWNARLHAAAQARKGQPASTKPASVATPAAAADTAGKAPQPGEPKDAKAKAAATGPDSPDDDAFGTATPASTDAGELPVELHPEAKVVAEYSLHWPADLEGKVQGVKVEPLILHYVRIEETNRPTKLFAHYQKELKGAKLRTIDRGRWLDLVDDGSAPGRKRSIDVMLKAVKAPPPPPPPGSKDADKNKNPEEPLVIEILSIEIPNPFPPEDEKPASKDAGSKAPKRTADKTSAKSADADNDDE